MSVLTKDQRATAIAQYERGVPPVETADRYGVTSSCIIQAARRAGIPSQRPDLANARMKREQTKQRSIEKEAAAARKASGVFHPNNRSQKMLAGVVERLMSQIPEDTRSFTARFCGDPLPGRSALDRRYEAGK